MKYLSPPSLAFYASVSVLTLYMSGCTPFVRMEVDRAIDEHEQRMEQLIREYCDGTDTISADTFHPVSDEQALLSGSTIGDKLIIGEVERVFVDQVGQSFEARIDTGAATSSIDARNIQLFERNGHQWVRFEVPLDEAEDEKRITVESRVVRFVRIRMPEGESERRPVIRAQVKLGSFVAETELNLNDRAHLDYPLLLGRRYIKDIAVVDVGRRYVQSESTTKANGE